MCSRFLPTWRGLHALQPDGPILRTMALSSAHLGLTLFRPYPLTATDLSYCSHEPQNMPDSVCGSNIAFVATQQRASTRFETNPRPWSTCASPLPARKRTRRV